MYHKIWLQRDEIKGTGHFSIWILWKTALSPKWQQYYLQNHKILLQCDLPNSSLRGGIYIPTPWNLDWLYDDNDDMNTVEVRLQRPGCSPWVVRQLPFPVSEAIHNATNMIILKPPCDEKYKRCGEVLQDGSSCGERQRSREALRQQSCEWRTYFRSGCSNPRQPSWDVPPTSANLYFLTQTWVK